MQLQTFEVLANVPKELQPVQEIASNLWFSWHYEAIELFRQLDPDLWEKAKHGPKHLLDIISQDKIKTFAKDESYQAYMQDTYRKFKDYFNEDTWFKTVCQNKCQIFNDSQNVIAYFSLEFGLDESVPTYSGGLGLLAGDHLKASSDLGLPLVAVGLLYQQGYFSQYLSSDGWQKEKYPKNDFFHMPLTLQKDESKKPILVPIEYKNRKVFAQIWRCDVGRVPLFLLDTNVDVNHEDDRQITGQLYGGDIEMRIRQEILIGVGGITALEMLGYNPIVCHMNEGHSAFLSLARIKRYISQSKLNLQEAIELVKATNVFTTHTPVPAGNDRFQVSLLTNYLSNLLAEIGMSKERFQALGFESADMPESFCMTVLALKMAAFANGVSELHGHVSRKMWQSVWPKLPVEEIPIGHITNGVHIRTWISHDLAELYEFYLGPKWGKDPQDEERLWDRVDKIPDTELWGTHERRRERLVSFARKNVVHSIKQSGAPLPEIKKAQEVLNPKALTIGFAKRFATYKRATLIFRNINRLKKILLDKDRPVQLIFAGKAHPHDNPGKKFIQKIAQYARDPELRNHIVFLEDYDISVARYLVQGCDVWLNNPRRPLEASGTSGMKAATNGVLNLSILDGWWCEAYNQQNGWAIGMGEEYDDPELQDEIEADNLYDLLEKEIVPLFYQRGFDDVPREWLAKMKTCIKTIAPVFSTARMVSDYTMKYYLPAVQNYKALTDDNFKKLKILSNWKQHIQSNWNNIKIDTIQSEHNGHLQVGDEIDVKTYINLGALGPNDVNVQLYYGVMNSDKDLHNLKTVSMNLEKSDVAHLYTGKITCTESGVYGYTVRVLPKHDLLSHPYEPNLITWK